jgi:hypothetical protein
MSISPALRKGHAHLYRSTSGRSPSAFAKSTKSTSSACPSRYATLTFRRSARASAVICTWSAARRQRPRGWGRAGARAGLAVDGLDERLAERAHRERLAGLGVEQEGRVRVRVRAELRGRQQAEEHDDRVRHFSPSAPSLCAVWGGGRTFGGLERGEEERRREEPAGGVRRDDRAHEVRERVVEVLEHEALEARGLEQREPALERAQRGADRELAVGRVQQRVDVRERQRCSPDQYGAGREEGGARTPVEAVAVAARAPDAGEAALAERVDLPDERGRAALVLGAQDGERLDGGDELARRRRVLQQALRRA